MPSTSVTPQGADVSYMKGVVALEDTHGTFDNRVIESAMREHIAFIEATTSLRHTNERLPRVQVWPPWQMMVVGGEDTLGMYLDGVIILPATFTHELDQRYGVLVHELVHYLQDTNGVEHLTCPRKDEVLAYKVSNAWVMAQPSSIRDRHLTSAEAIRSASTC